MAPFTIPSADLPVATRTTRLRDERVVLSMTRLRIVQFGVVWTSVMVVFIRSIGGRGALISGLTAGVSLLLFALHCALQIRTPGRALWIGLTVPVCSGLAASPLLVEIPNFAARLATSVPLALQALVAGTLACVEIHRDLRAMDDLIEGIEGVGGDGT